MSERIKILQNVDAEEIELHAKTPLPDDNSTRVATTEWVWSQRFLRDGDEIENLKIHSLDLERLNVKELSFDLIKILDKNGNIFSFQKEEDGVLLKLVQKLKDLNQWFTISDENGKKLFQLNEENSLIKTSSFVMEVDDTGKTAEILNDLNFHPHFEGENCIKIAWDEQERKIKYYLEATDTSTIQIKNEDKLKAFIRYNPLFFVIDENGLSINVNFFDERYVNAQGNEVKFNNLYITGDLTVDGNTTLKGEKTTIESDEVEIKDRFVRINKVNADEAGIVFNDDDVSLYYDKQTDEFYLKYSDNRIKKIISENNVFETIQGEDPIYIEIIDDKGKIKFRYNTLQFRVRDGLFEINPFYEERFVFTDLSNVDPTLLIRKIEEVDGSGSGLDADFLDGHDSSYFAVDDEVVHKSGDELIEGQKTFVNDVLVQGNLTVQGDLTSINTVNLEIQDNVIVLNKGETSGSVSKGTAGIEIDRSPSSPARLIFDDNDDTWKIDFGDGNLYKIYSSKDSLEAETLDGYHAEDFAFVDLRNVDDNVILTKVKNVDGSGSGLDADTLDGKHADEFANINLSNVDNNIILIKLKEIDGPNSGLNADLLDNYHADDFAFADLRNVSANTVLERVKQADGSGSGLDADLLDGHHASEFILKSGDRMEGQLVADSLNVNTIYFNLPETSTDTLLIRRRQDAHDRTTFEFQLGDNMSGDDKFEISTYPSGNYRWLFRVFNNGNVSVLGKVYAANGQKELAYNDLSNVDSNNVLNKVKEVDGSGSGLDADLLDGHHASDFALADLSNVDESILQRYTIEKHRQVRTIPAYSYIEYDISDLTSDTSLTFWDSFVIVRVKDENESSSTYDYWVNGEAVSTVAINSGGNKLRIYNNHNENLQFDLTFYFIKV